MAGSERIAVELVSRAARLDGARLSPYRCIFSKFQM